MEKEELGQILINPYYAIEIAPELATKHEPMTSKEAWIKANAHLIDEIGKEEWLNRLLHVLETGGIKELSEDDIPH